MANTPTPRKHVSIDPLLQQRLQELGSRRPGAPLPPPEATARPGAQARSGKRVKPARGSKAASLALSVATTAGLAALFATTDTPTESVVLTAGTVGTAAPAAATSTTAPGNGAGGATATTPVTAAPTQAPTTPAAGGIVDGTYVGGASRNRFGYVQVQAVYSGGQLADVQILRYPDGDRRSISINQRSLPRLIDEAISVQGANVDNISGATYTSRSYVQSLQSAIDAAKAASGIA